MQICACGLYELSAQVDCNENSDMSGHLLWQFVSYALLLGFGVSFALVELWLPAAVLGCVVPLWRIWRRFDKEIGYRMMSNMGIRPTSFLGDGRRVTRQSSPALFKICLVLEVLMIMGLLGLFLTAQWRL